LIFHVLYSDIFDSDLHVKSFQKSVGFIADSDFDQGTTFVVDRYDYLLVGENGPFVLQAAQLQVLQELRVLAG
jgi:hypothetical protein